MDHLKNFEDGLQKAKEDYYKTLKGLEVHLYGLLREVSLRYPKKRISYTYLGNSIEWLIEIERLDGRPFPYLPIDGYEALRIDIDMEHYPRFFNLLTKDHPLYRLYKYTTHTDLAEREFKFDSVAFVNGAKVT